ncbi:IS5 family transposase [Bathymodiolus thermophilus thioautotrophic gill symbiont]|uniref:IS5 family transposase n=1 Tax=Bathymodiolus thermophilus thioautotrophic gill symbiont TaxID=2360 RepID=A0A3G3IIZ7_9GAMM|nr:IS5 family transposase [Bathymodiolus thermophilus thioautotrophic gill symbiont]AYQ55816.1 IS5 family transposase [Bathymodiolus thermophilus thioautotrophic gill symbiont]
MRVKTTQEQTFADSFINIPNSQLDIINKVIDWEVIAKDLSHIKVDYSAVSLFKALLIGTWHNLSDEKLADSLSRDLVFINFCNFSLSGNKPDATTIGRFRTKLIKQNLFDRLLSSINLMLENNQLKLSNGKHVAMDATLIQSARRTKKIITTHKTGEVYEIDSNPIQYSDDKDARWTFKAGKYTYGYSSVVTTDANGLINKATTHPANDSEMTHFEENVKQAGNQKGVRVLYDKGTASQANSEALKAQKLRDGIMRKKPKGKQMSHWNKLRNKAISKRRFVVERTFGTLKRTYGLARSRYIGLEKVASEVNLKAIAYNLVRAANVYINKGLNAT